MAVKLIDIIPVYEGKFLKYYNFVLDDGRNYEVIARQELTIENVNNFSADATDIIVFDDKFQKILVVKEWRVPVNDYIYAFPAGLCEANESVFEAATRELFEETGLHITSLFQILPPAYQSAGMTNETVASVICSASGELSNKYSSKDEDIIPMWITKTEAEDILLKGKLSGRCQMVLYLWVNNNLFSSKL